MLLNLIPKKKDIVQFVFHLSLELCLPLLIQSFGVRQDAGASVPPAGNSLCGVLLQFIWQWQRESQRLIRECCTVVALVVSCDGSRATPRGSRHWDFIHVVKCILMKRISKKYCLFFNHLSALQSMLIDQNRLFVNISIKITFHSLANALFPS